ncbi:putative F-box protein At3g23260 [Physcomitrium patens]|uniref:F-box domain-containing protein n=1 Tax=Physcomitrium patens TaxID=3218 RepID=A0A2K1J4C0_PHYPA|nr:uncharacterized protein LOC112294012 [Physcomitrium patens]PNR36374.1 hypothetical protein PHYPA_022225 [Physcomitrium patens]|eukprot:XP_024399852.1 uncharacterized protein LOC112294012 [Physcomitrella patens]
MVGVVSRKLDAKLAKFHLISSLSLSLEEILQVQALGLELIRSLWHTNELCVFYVGSFIWDEVAMADGCKKLAVPKLPRDLQHKVLSYLPFRTLLQARCVCKDWRDVIYVSDFCSMYDELHSSQTLVPTICYAGSFHGRAEVEWAAYDCVEEGWGKMISLRPPYPKRRLERNDIANCDSVYPVGGLLCFHLKMGVSTWVVWNPLTGNWKILPPCKLAVGESFIYVHAFVTDDTTKAYKILMAHWRAVSQSKDYSTINDDGPLVMEIYDSTTGTWSEPKPYIFRSHGFTWNNSTRGGVRSNNGVIYFPSEMNSDNRYQHMLLFYDTRSGQWHEELSDKQRNVLFEWDGRVMTIERNPSNGRFIFYEWDEGPDSKGWMDTGIEVPKAVQRKFDPSHFGIYHMEITAGGDYLVMTGPRRGGGFRTTVYSRADQCWRCPLKADNFWNTSMNGFFSGDRINGMVQFSPRLSWLP